mmetsp:Transcript_46993/g.110672  ORF Transcript_46993/g.110672 Transcript_46993/m.110672 type:complete len:258 (-) Transcript_46993:1422-2195(-)
MLRAHCLEPGPLLLFAVVADQNRLAPITRKRSQASAPGVSGSRMVGVSGVEVQVAAVHVVDGAVDGHVRLPRVQHLLQIRAPLLRQILLHVAHLAWSRAPQPRGREQGRLSRKRGLERHRRVRLSHDLLRLRREQVVDRRLPHFQGAVLDLRAVVLRQCGVQAVCRLPRPRCHRLVRRPRVVRKVLIHVADLFGHERMLLLHRCVFPMSVDSLVAAVTRQPHCRGRCLPLHRSHHVALRLVPRNHLHMASGAQRRRL